MPVSGDGLVDCEMTTRVTTRRVTLAIGAALIAVGFTVVIGAIFVAPFGIFLGQLIALAGGLILGRVLLPGRTSGGPGGTAPRRHRPTLTRHRREGQSRSRQPHPIVRRTSARPQHLTRRTANDDDAQPTAEPSGTGLQRGGVERAPSSLVGVIE